jgi:phosphate uptake regulator
VQGLRNALHHGLHTPVPELSKDRAMDLALIGRYFERMADHAVAVAHHLLFRAGAVTLD